MYISHCHSKYSHDSECELISVIDKAVSQGVKALAITDHCNCNFTPERNDFLTINACVDEVNSLKERYAGKIKLLAGIEIAEEIHRRSAAEKIRKSRKFDVVLGSCHEYKKDGEFLRLATQKYDEWEKSEVDKMVAFYYDNLLSIVSTTDIDVLSHLTLPLRYLKKRGVAFDNTIFDSVIAEIFSVMKKKDIALELNTSGVKSGLFLPDAYYLDFYKNAGGKLITIGTDSHVAENVTQGFKEGLELLKSVGFSEYYYFEKRKPFAVDIRI